MPPGIENLERLYARSDTQDRVEGALVFRRYRKVMVAFGEAYSTPVRAVTEAFVALSPSNEYHGNLRSLSSVLHGVNVGARPDQIAVTTFNACRDRAVRYVTGEVDFLKTVKGLKIRAFRDNILFPRASREVTVDGHMIAAWHDAKFTMKQAALMLRRKAEYLEIANGIRALADAEGLAPCQMQAILWLTRKRLFEVKINLQGDLFMSKDDISRTLCDPKDFPPYPLRKD